MADTKISALTAATTPLAGTEVLPIVQSGVTKQVSVADLTAGRAVSAASLTLTTALTAANGGTGQSSYAVGDLLYASTTTALSKLADVATGNALISGGVGVAPSWGKIGLTTHVSGTLGVTNGGTGLSSATTGDLLYASGTNTWASLADVATGNALISGGVGVAPSWGKIGLATHVSGTLGTTNGGTGLTSFTANGVVYASSTSALATGTGLTFDGTTLQITSGSLNLGGGGANGYISGGTWYGINSGNWVFQAGNASQAFRWNGSSGSVRMFLDINNNLLLGTTSSPAGSGNFLINNGNVIQGTAATGFNFTANTPAAGKTSQLLNWYEEGTWTPTAVSGVSFYGPQGWYNRVGRIVYCYGTINTTSITGNITLGGLPFTSANTATQYLGNARFQIVTAGDMEVAANGTQVQIYITGTQIGGAYTQYFAFQYQTA